MNAAITSDYTIDYQESGQGRILVLLHAFPLNPTMWQPQFDGLEGFRIIAPSLYSFGPHQGTFTVEQMADDVAALLDHLQIVEPVVVGGLSMGGYAAMAFARRHPQRLNRLILADTRAESDTPEARANREKTIAKAASEGAHGVWQAQKEKMFSPHTFDQRPELIDDLTLIAEQQSAAQIIGATKALRDRPDAREGLAQLHVPTLVIVGEDDAITPPDAARAMTDLISDARLETIPQAGHLSNWEQPERFNRVVREFMVS